MSARHPDFCDLVERICQRREQHTSKDRRLLCDYARTVPGEIEDQLDRWTRETVEEFTGNPRVWTPRRAAQALVRTMRADGSWWSDRAPASES